MFSTIRDFINHQVANSTDITLRDFIIGLNTHFYPTQDISFMDYFFELAKEENDGQFIVPHHKLIEYGVATSDRSNDIKERLVKLDLEENQDYRVLRGTPQNSKKGGRPQKVYMLTPDAFKLALQRARKTDTQSIDPKIYSLYYQFLEKVVKYYSDYQVAKLTIAKGSLESTLSNLLSKVDGIVDSNKRLEKHAEEQEKLAKKAEFDLNSVKTSLNSKLDRVVTMLQEKSIVSTINPSNSKLHHNFVVMGYKFVEENGLQGRKISFIAGQEVNVRGAMRKKFDDEDHDWTVQVGMHYNANPIDLRNNIQSRVSKFLKEVITKENLRRAHEVSMKNEACREEIKEHNKANPDGKRFFRDEKISVVKLHRSEIPISCTRTTASYVENDYVSYDELIEVIKSVNDNTQKSPYESEVSDVSETSDADTTSE